LHDWIELENAGSILNLKPIPATEPRIDFSVDLKSTALMSPRISTFMKDSIPSIRNKVISYFLFFKMML